MKGRTFLSVIIPCYNAAKTVIGTLECMVNAFGAFHDYEIIVVDDGSTDTSVSLIEGFCVDHKNVRLYSKENGGVSSARNYGLEKATGTYVWFFDADDLLFDGAAIRVIDYLQTYAPDILRFHSVTIDSKTEKLADKYNNLDRCKVIFHGVYSQYLRDGIVGFSCWSHIIKRDLLVRFGIRFNEELSMHEDVAWGLSIAQACHDAKFVYVDLAVVKYMVRGSSLVNTTNSTANQKHLMSTIMFANMLSNSNINWGGWMSKTLQRYRDSNSRHLITKHLSCKFGYACNRKMAKEINLILSRNENKYGKIYRYATSSTIVFMMLQVLYRNIFLRFIKPYIGRN